MLTTPADTQRRAALLAEVDERLKTADTQAVQLTRNSSQRTLLETLTNYLFGAIVAILGTILWAFGLALRRKYRVRRTMSMRVSLK